MKEIKAYIKRHKLTAVTMALHKVDGLTGMSIVDVRGFGRGKDKDVPHRVVEDLVDYVPHVKIEIVCRNGLVESVISAIEKTAHTGLRGDGKIYVSNVEEVIRIATGERGKNAI